MVRDFCVRHYKCKSKPPHFFNLVFRATRECNNDPVEYLAYMVLDEGHDSNVDMVYKIFLLDYRVAEDFRDAPSTFHIIESYDIN